MRPAHVAIGIVLVTAGCGHFSVRPASETFEAGEHGPARLCFEGELPVAEVSGTPDEIGAQLGALAGTPARELLASWRFADFFRSIVETSTASAEELEAVVPPEYRREVATLSRVAGIDARALLRANAVIDACACTAFAASGTATGGVPLVVGRNMDFAPANVLGAKTLVTVYHPDGAHAFVAIGWPGFAAVASGMNDRGLCALILVNSAAKPRGDGVPLGFLARMILERCASVEEARAFFRAHAPASGHFLFLADARTAAVMSRDAPDRALEDGLLACTNGEVDPQAKIQTDPRARCVWDLLLREEGKIDVETSRSILAATYLALENSHAMVFEPGARVLWLARGTTFEPAALAHWDRLALGPALDGTGPVAASPCRPVAERFKRWKDFDYPGLLVERKIEANRPAPPSVSGLEVDAPGR